MSKPDKEDVYLRVSDENSVLKRQVHDHESTIRRLTTQMRIKDAAMKKEGLADESANIVALMEELTTAKHKNRTLSDQVRNLQSNVIHKAQAAGKTVDYGRLPQSGRKPLSVGVNTPTDLSGGKLRAGSISISGGGGGRRHSQSPESTMLAAASPRGGGGGGSSSGSTHTPRSMTHANTNDSSYRPTTAPASSSSDARAQLAESRLAVVTAEVESLRRRLVDAESSSRQMMMASGGGGGGGVGGGAHTFSSSSSSVSVPRGDLLELERQLKDKTAQLLLLKSRYEHLETKSAAERELYDRAVCALEEQNAQIRDARSGLQAAEADVSLLRSRLRAQEDMEGDLRASREEVRRLERTLTELCESPFMTEGRDRVNKAEKLEELQREAAASKEQVVHLQHSVRSQHLELTALRKEKREAGELNDKLREEITSLKITADAAGRANSTLRERLALYSGMVGMEGTASMATSGSISGEGGGISSMTMGGSIPPEELERALTLVRKRVDNPGQIISTSSDAITSTTNSNGSDDAPLLRRKAQQLQLALLSSQRELERCEAMLKAQTSISQDLSAEVAELNERLSTETASVRRRLADTETLAEKRLQRIHLLEPQVKQLMAQLRDAKTVVAEKKKQVAAAVATAAKGSSGGGAVARRPSSGFGGSSSSHNNNYHDDEDDDASTVISALSGDDDRGNTTANGGIINAGVHDDSAEDSLGASMLDFGPGEDALEIYIVEATIDPAMLGRHDATFAQIDFFNFESQISPLANGPAPSYNFSAAYRVVTDAFFLRNLAISADGGGAAARIDINQAKGAEFELVARAVVPLHKLLSTKNTTKLKHTALPLVSKAGKVIGSVKVEVRIAIALGEMWDQFTRDQPAEGARLSNLMRDAEKRNEEASRQDGASSSSSSSSSSNAAATSSSSSTTDTLTGMNANELIVTVVGASDLMKSSSSRNGGAPNTYVQYTLPGMAMAVTPLVKGSCNPVFSDARHFPLVPTARILQSLAQTPVQFTIIDDDATNNVASAMAAKTGGAPASSAVLGTATVNLAAVIEGGTIDTTYDVIGSNSNNNGGMMTSVGKLHIRIRWARPLATVDGSPANSLTRSQVQALSAVFDHDGNGVKHALLHAAVSASAASARALDRIREAIAFSSSSSSSSSSSRVKWSRALLDAAEAAGRQGALLTSTEITNALSSVSAGGVAIDQNTIEEALKGFSSSSANTSSSSSAAAAVTMMSADDLVDIFSPLSPAAASAMAKVRRFISTIPRSEDGPRFDYALEDEAEAGARRVYGAGTETSSSISKAQMMRVSRNGVFNALKYIGMVITEDFSSTIGGSSSSTTKDPRAASDFDADPNRSVMPGVTETLRNGFSEEIEGANTLVHPSVVSELAAAQMAIVQSAAATISTRGETATAYTNTTATTTSSSSSAAVTRRGSSTKELVFDNTNQASTSTSAAETAVTASAVVKVKTIDSFAGDTNSSSSLVIQIEDVDRLHSSLVSRLNSNNSSGSSSNAAKGSSASSPCVFLTYTIPSSRKSSTSATPTSVQPITVVLAGVLGTEGSGSSGTRSILSFTPHSRTFGSGSAFAVTTTFPLTKDSTFASVISSMLAPGAAPEDADIVFTLSYTPPTIEAGVPSWSTSADSTPSTTTASSSIFATATYSLLDMVADGRDADNLSLPCYSTETVPGVPQHTSLADLRLSIRGWSAVKAASLSSFGSK